MSFKDLINDKLALSQQSASSMMTFKEYLDSTKNKILRWTSYTAEDVAFRTEILTISIYDQTLGQVVAAITPDQYAACLNEDVQYVSLALNEAGDTVQVAATDVISAVEDLTNEVTLQSTFISECLDNTEVEASRFITRVQSLNDYVTGEQLENYVNLLKSGDPVESLKTLFSTVKIGSAQKKNIGANEYISLSSASSFTGANILAVAWENLWGKISSFFNVAWQGILKIGEYIGKLFEGLVNCVKWLVKTVMKPLTTRYDKANSSIGIMDLPILQMELCSMSQDATLGFFIDDISDAVTDMIDVWEQGTAYRPTSDTNGPSIADENNRLSDKVLKLSRATDDGRFMSYFQALCSACLEEIEGSWYFRPYDITIPTGNFDIIARFGVSEQHKLTLLLYCAIPYSTIGDASDGDIYKMIQQSCAGLVRTVGQVFPIWFNSYNPSGDISSYWLKDTNDDDNVDIVSNNYVFDLFTDNPSGLTPAPETYCKNWWCNFLLNGLAPYCVMFGPAYQNVIENYHPGWNQNYWNNEYDLLRMFLCWADDYSQIGGRLYSMIYYDHWPDVMNQIDYRPYVQSNLYGVSVHYQTLDEAANELLKYIIVIIIAAAAVFIAVKWNKFKKKRQSLAEIRQGYVENMSWNLPQNPSPEQIRNYQKAKRISKRTNKLNGMLGLSSSGKKSMSIIDTAFSIKDQLLSMQGASESQQVESYTLSSLRSAMSGDITNATGESSLLVSTINNIGSNVTTILNNVQYMDISEIKSKLSDIANSIIDISNLIK